MKLTRLRSPFDATMIRSLFALCLVLNATIAHAVEPARVVLVATYHFSNPGQDRRLG